MADEKVTQPDGTSVNDSQNQGNQEPKNEPNNPQPVDPEKLLAEKLKELGFNSIEELKALKEKAEKASKESPEDENLKKEFEKLQNQLNQLQTAYKTEKVRASIIASATKLGVIDPEMVVLLAREKAEVKDGKVLVDGKPVEEFLKELKEQKPYLFRASDKEGSGAGISKEPPKEKSTDEKLAKLIS